LPQQLLLVLWLAQLIGYPILQMSLIFSTDL
jgi:hypothetical protein